VPWVIYSREKERTPKRAEGSPSALSLPPRISPARDRLGLAAGTGHRNDARVRSRPDRGRHCLGTFRSASSRATRMDASVAALLAKGTTTLNRASRHPQLRRTAEQFCHLRDLERLAYVHDQRHSHRRASRAHSANSVYYSRFDRSMLGNEVADRYHPILLLAAKC
jgi:hypothetical protein